MQLKTLVKWMFRFVTDKNYRFLFLASRSKYDSMADKQYLKKYYKAVFEHELNLKAPKTYTEKMQWLKLYDRKEIYTVMVDKYRVRKYVSDKIGGQYLIPLLGVWDHPDEIDFDSLPNQFVLKCNHNSGEGMCICKDKRKLNIRKVKRGLAVGLKENYYLKGREWPYKDVPRRIICEKYMKDNECEGLTDYKVMCFNGIPKLVQVHRGRFTDSHTQDFYSTEWEKLEINQVNEHPSEDVLPVPKLLDEMLHLSAILAADIPHIRVDWYIINGQLYVGELTFFDASGFDPFNNYEDDLLLGSWITLPPKTV